MRLPKFLHLHTAATRSPLMHPIGTKHQQHAWLSQHYPGIVVLSAPVIHLPWLHDTGGRQKPARPPQTAQRIGCIEHVSDLIVARLEYSLMFMFIFVCVKLPMASAIAPRGENPVLEYRTCRILSNLTFNKLA